jgi:hypothetical protein
LALESTSAVEHDCLDTHLNRTTQLRPPRQRVSSNG